MMSPLPAFHLRLRRQRRARSFKQAWVAALLGVDQSTVSRWEAGRLLPQAAFAERALQLLSAAPADDCALRRLVRMSLLPCHLVTDTDHRLLAVSPARERGWRRPVADLMGMSLWRFATPEIVAAEARLDAGDWWDAAAPVVVNASAGWPARCPRPRPRRCCSSLPRTCSAAAAALRRCAGSAPMSASSCA